MIIRNTTRHRSPYYLRHSSLGRVVFTEQIGASLPHYGNMAAIEMDSDLSACSESQPPNLSMITLNSTNR